MKTGDPAAIAEEIAVTGRKTAGDLPPSRRCRLTRAGRQAVSGRNFGRILTPSHDRFKQRC